MTENQGNQQDRALLAAFHLMDADERSLYVEAMQLHTEGRATKKPVLTLVSSRAAHIRVKA